MTEKTWAECQRGVQLTDLERKGSINGSHLWLKEEESHENNELKGKGESVFDQKIDFRN